MAGLCCYTRSGDGSFTVNSSSRRVMRTLLSVVQQQQQQYYYRTTIAAVTATTSETTITSSSPRRRRIRNNRTLLLLDGGSSSTAAASATAATSSNTIITSRRNFHKTAVTALSDSDGGGGGDGDDNGNNTNKGNNNDPGDNNDNDDDDEEELETLVNDVPLYQTINSTYTDDEIAAIIEEEEAKLEAEERAKFVENWKPGMRKRPLVSGYNLEDFKYEFQLEDSQEDDSIDPPPPLWTLRDKRCGALAIKLGMMPVFDSDALQDIKPEGDDGAHQPTGWGVRYPCTVLWLDNNVVLRHKTMDKHGYMSVQVAAGERKRKNVGKSVLGQYKQINLDSEDNPPFLIKEFRVTDEQHLIPVGTQIHARHFVPGQNLDVSATSKGKGFQGAMKRHNFKGLPATHGVSKSHRSLGSTGQCQDPGKVFKGKKMAGRMGGERVTVQNLRIIKIDRGRNLLYVLGAVPGNKGEFVELRDAVKKPLWGTTNKVIGDLDRPPLPTYEYDLSIDGCGMSHEEFMPLPSRNPLMPDQDNEEVAA